MNLCTLFDSNYIDRALVMYDSLKSSCDCFTLYVIAFDDKCYNTLTELNLPGMVITSYDEFEDDILREVKSNRSTREFLWTCSGYSIRYLMIKYALNDLTYIDSDLYFYASPEPALQKFLESDCDAAIISHRYSKHPENEYNAKMYGQYCVQFNTFKNTPNGMTILNWWVDKCLECCTENATDELFGDQKYLDMFTSLFTGVYIYEDFGMGIAPWNVDEYVEASETPESKDARIYAKNTRSGESGSIIFYHFHSLDIFADGSSNIRVFIRPGHHDRKLIDLLYKPYIQKIIKKRAFLRQNYGLFDPSKQPSGQIIHEGELKMFLTCEPSLLFLVRKIWRYMLHKKKDYL